MSDLLDWSDYVAERGPLAECEWCRIPDSTNDSPDVDTLCRPHLAEHEGLSVDELDRMESEQLAEWRDAHE